MNQYLNIARITVTFNITVSVEMIARTKADAVRTLKFDVIVSLKGIKNALRALQCENVILEVFCSEIENVILLVGNLMISSNKNKVFPSKGV